MSVHEFMGLPAPKTCGDCNFSQHCHRSLLCIRQRSAAVIKWKRPSHTHSHDPFYVSRISAGKLANSSASKSSTVFVADIDERDMAFHRIAGTLVPFNLSSNSAILSAHQE
jgi:hypothetical protein